MSLILCFTVGGRNRLRRPDLTSDSGISAHGKGCRAAAGPGPSTWHPVPWTGSLWFGGDPGPSESRHTPAVAVLGYRHTRGRTAPLLPLCCMWEGRVLHPCCFRWKILSSQQFWGWASRRDLTEVATESHCAEITLVLIGAVKCFAQTSSASSQSFSPSC